MADDPKVAKLLEALREATVHGRLEWDEALHDSSFRVVTDNAMIRLESGLDEEERESYYQIVLMDRKGRIADIYRIGESHPRFRIAEQLFELVRRAALRADDLLDRAIADVESLKS